MITNEKKANYEKEMKSPIRKALLHLVKDCPGRTAKELAHFLDKRPSDIGKMLRSMEHGGLVYGAPLSRASNVHGWHLNSLDMSSRKTKIVTQLWNGRLKL